MVFSFFIVSEKIKKVLEETKIIETVTDAIKSIFEDFASTVSKAVTKVWSILSKVGEWIKIAIEKN